MDAQYGTSGNNETDAFGAAFATQSDQKDSYAHEADAADAQVAEVAGSCGNELSGRAKPHEMP